MTPHYMTTISHRLRTIDSCNHYHIQNIHHLHTRVGREETGLFYIEGLRLVYQAIQNGAAIKQLVVSKPLLTNPLGRTFIKHAHQHKISILEVTPDIMHYLSLIEDSQGIGAIVQQHWEPLSRIDLISGLCWIALQAVRTPGNLGTLLRTSDAVGGAGIILLSNITDPYDPSTVRATMGAMFTQYMVRTTFAEFKRWKNQHNYILIGTSPAATVDYQTIIYPKASTILFMGEERKGLPPEMQSLCDTMVSIPMVGQSDSLNLGVATSIMLYEVFNQQRNNTITALPDAIHLIEQHSISS